MFGSWVKKTDQTGTRFVLRDDGSQFGLASNGFPHDKVPILVGWYGDLLTTFLGM